MMGLLGILPAIPSTEWLRLIGAFTLTEQPMSEPLSLFVLFPFPNSPVKLFAKFSLSNCVWLTTGRWTQWLQS
jgi:hypothetical protein